MFNCQLFFCRTGCFFETKDILQWLEHEASSHPSNNKEIRLDKDGSETVALTSTQGAPDFDPWQVPHFPGHVADKDFGQAIDDESRGQETVGKEVGQATDDEAPGLVEVSGQVSDDEDTGGQVSDSNSGMISDDSCEVGDDSKDGRTIKHYYYSSDDLNDKKADQEEEKSQCHVCQKMLAVTYLNKHMSRAHGHSGTKRNVDKAPKVCTYSDDNNGPRCSFVASSFTQLRQHMAKEHQAVVRNKKQNRTVKSCHVCGKETVELLKHLRKTHNIFKCSRYVAYYHQQIAYLALLMHTLIFIQ